MSIDLSTCYRFYFNGYCFLWFICCGVQTQAHLFVRTELSEIEVLSIRKPSRQERISWIRVQHTPRDSVEGLGTRLSLQWDYTVLCWEHDVARVNKSTMKFFYYFHCGFFFGCLCGCCTPFITFCNYYQVIF